MKQKFTGTKTVMAEPMTAEVAIKKGYRVNGSGDGYEVEYEDGYKSWSPADVFNKAYKPAKTPLDRMDIELYELGNRKKRLLDAIDNKKLVIPMHQRRLMYMQYHAMETYYAILRERYIDMSSQTDN